MRQPKKTGSNKKSKVKSGKTKRVTKKRNNKEFGTSKLELFFVQNYLNKYKLDYVYQFKTNEGRYYDFAIIKNCLTPKKKVTCGIEHVVYRSGMEIDFLIEVDGDYYHSNPNMYDESNLNKIQLRNKKVDEEKTNWAIMNNIPLVRLWETDIKTNKKKILEELSKYVRLEKKK